MSQYKYSLDRSPKKFECPNCNKRRFVRYVDNEIEEYFMSDFVGKCDRIQNCNYHFTPKQYFERNPSQKPTTNFIPRPIPKPLKPSFIEPSIFEYCKGLDYSACNFVNYIIQLFDGEQLKLSKRVIDVLYRYRITPYKGKYHNWNNAVIFWQFDINGNIRTGKVMGYSENGKRIKNPPKIHFVHAMLKKQGKIKAFQLQQCFYGEHLLKKYPIAKVGIVESEKTAVIMSVIKPNIVWLSTGGRNGAKWTETSVYQVLKGRSVVLFPDLGEYENWSKQAQRMQSVELDITVSSLLERYASESEKKEGYDIADYAIASGWHILKQNQS